MLRSVYRICFYEISMMSFFRSHSMSLYALRPALWRASVVFFVCLFFYACGVPRGQVRLSGKYTNIKQGDFFILSTDGAIMSVDTLHIMEGEFKYVCDLPEAATFRIIYPNQSQLIIWCHGGDDIQITGDVQDLWHVQVTGNEENELYSQFRQQNTATDTVSLRKSAAQFIRENPSSKVSLFLLEQYFIIPDDVKADSTQRLFDCISKALPKDPQVATLGGLVQQRYNLSVGSKIPAFDLVTTDSVHHSLKDYKDKMLVLYFWAGWEGNMGYTHRELAKLRDERKEADDHAKELELLGYCLDVDTILKNVNMPDKSFNIPTYFDHQGFNGSFVSLLGVRSVPLMVLVGSDGKIAYVCHDVNEVRRYFDDKK